MRHPITRADVQARPSLTERDVETLRLIAGGATNQAVARHFDVSTATIGRRLTELFERLGARDRTHAAVIALVTNVVGTTNVQLPTWVQVELNATREPLRDGG
jgi:Response regulator containing a CheY-like receiver domain and an HTH DNA-binding domain